MSQTTSIGAPPSGWIVYVSVIAEGRPCLIARQLAAGPQAFASQRPLTQSTGSVHAAPSSQGSQLPPQSTSDSSPLWTPSSQSGAPVLPSGEPPDEPPEPDSASLLPSDGPLPPVSGSAVVTVAEVPKLVPVPSRPDPGPHANTPAIA